MSRPYPFKRKPYSHQVQALKFALRLKKAALLMEPRTGKTKVAIDWLSALSMAGKLDRVVIIAPARVLDVWVQAFHDDCPVRYHIHMWDAKARKHPIPKVSGNYDLSVVLVNYEAFSTSGAKLPSGRASTRTGRFKHRALIEGWLEGKPAACVLDESHKIKSPSGRAASMIVSMAGYFDYRLILTGTPITKAKRAFDIYGQWKFMNPARLARWRNVEAFKQYFGEWSKEYNDRTGGSYLELKQMRNMDELTELIYQDSYHVTRDECFDLPPRSTNMQPIILEGRSGAVYDELAKEMVATLEHEQQSHIIEAAHAMTMTLRLLQICGGFATTPTERDEDGKVLVQGTTLPVGREKLDALAGIFEDHIENEEKLVVAARFRPEMNAITAMAEKMNLPVYEVRGGLTRELTTANIEAFRTETGAAVLVMQPQAGGVGIDLSTAAHMVWYSLTPSWVDYTQSCDRIALSKKATTYTYLLAKGTVDELLYGTLIEDGDIAKAILRDPRKVLRT